MMKKLRIDRRKLSNLCSGDAKRSFVKSAEKRTSEVEFFCAVNPKMIQKVFSENFVLFPKWFSAQLECRSDGHAERFQPLFDTSFSLNSKNYVRTVTFFSGESNSHQMIAFTRKLHFLKLRRNICAKSVEVLIQNLGIDEKIKIVRTIIQNCTLATENVVLSTVQKNGPVQSNYFPL